MSQHQQNIAINKEDRQTIEAKNSVRVIEERLRGIYNLRNPNSRKIRRTDIDNSSSSTDDQDENLLPLSVEGQVEKMIAEATSSKNLVQVSFVIIACSVVFLC